MIDRLRVEKNIIALGPASYVLAKSIQPRNCLRHAQPAKQKSSPFQFCYEAKVAAVAAKNEIKMAKITSPWHNVI